jgi:hypothetical protein
MSAVALTKRRSADEFSTAEAGRRLGVSRITAYWLCRSGELIARIIAGRYVVRLADLEAYANARELRRRETSAAAQAA